MQLSKRFHLPIRYPNPLIPIETSVIGVVAFDDLTFVACIILCGCYA